MQTYLPYLVTLRRVPDDIILAAASREIVLHDATRCVCGRLAREIAADQRGVDAEEFDDVYVTDFLASELGGEIVEWAQINGAYSSPEASAALELAFVERVLECVP